MQVLVIFGKSLLLALPLLVGVTVLIGVARQLLRRLRDRGSRR